MLDRNPFREYKEILKRKRLSESSPEQEYNSWNIVSDPESTEDELHGAIDHFKQYGGVSPGHFYEKLQQHPNFNDTHDKKIPWGPHHPEWHEELRNKIV
jgi:hypothetical protein